MVVPFEDIDGEVPCLFIYIPISVLNLTHDCKTRMFN